MSTSMPLPNVLVPGKTATPPSPVAATAQSKASTAADDTGLSFKQSLQKMEPTPKASAGAAAQTTAQSDSEAATEDEAVESPLMFVQLMGLRQNTAESEAPRPMGLSYLARFAAAMGATNETQPQEGSAQGLEVPAAIMDSELPILTSADTELAAAAVTTLPLSVGVKEATSAVNELSVRFNTNVTDSAAGGKLLPPALNMDADLLSPPTSTNSGIASSFSSSLESASPLASPLQALQKGLPVDIKSLVTESTLAGTAILADAAAAGDLEAQPPLSAAGLQKPGSLPLQLEGRTALPVNVAFGTAQWSNALAERTAWMAGQAIQSAEIQLDPPELGPLQIKIQVNQDQASVNFVSANPLVREAVEQTMGRLRELFQGQGMELVDSGVADQQSGQQREPPEPGNLSGSLGSSDDEGTALDGELHQVVTAVPWGVDYYA